MERFIKWKLSLRAIRCYYSTSIAPKPPVLNYIHPLPLIRQPTSSISFRSCGFSSSSYFRQGFSQSGHLNQFHCSSKRFFSSLKPMAAPFAAAFVATFVAGEVVLCGFRYLPDVKKVPYTQRKRISMFLDVDVGKLGEILLQITIKKWDSKGQILPANDPRSVKVCSILKNVLGTLYEDLGLDEIPRVTYHGLTDTISTEPNEKGIADMSFKQIRRKIRGWRTDISHLKGRNWKVVVVDEPEPQACSTGDGIIAVYTGLLDTYSDVEIATFLAHEVGHCVARHCAESIVLLWEDMVLYDELMCKLLNPTRHFEPIRRRIEIEADYISLRLMASAGIDPHDVLQSYEKLNTCYQNNNSKTSNQNNNSGSISLEERIQLLSRPHVMQEAFTIYRNTAGRK